MQYDEMHDLKQTKKELVERIKALQAEKDVKSLQFAELKQAITAIKKDLIGFKAERRKILDQIKELKRNPLSVPSVL